MNQLKAIIENGLVEPLRAAAVEVFDEAFGAKMALAIPDAEKCRAVISEGLDGDHLIVATIGGELAGVAALCTRDDPYAGGSLSDESITWAMLRRHLGTLGAVRAALVLPAFGHRPQADELYLEDIAVAGAARGRGIGSKLLAEVEIIARELGKARVRLQVTDSNARAHELYARRGYVVVGTNRFGFLRRFIGFGGVYTMDLFLDRAMADDD